MSTRGETYYLKFGSRLMRPIMRAHDFVFDATKATRPPTKNGAPEGTPFSQKSLFRLGDQGQATRMLLP